MTYVGCSRVVALFVTRDCLVGSFTEGISRNISGAEDISAVDLKARLDAGDSITLVAILSEFGFDAKHIPGSVRAMSMAEAEERTSGGDAIVVYCSDVDCAASSLAVRTMIEAGYVNVIHFSGGLSAWEDAGYPLEGSSVG